MNPSIIGTLGIAAALVGTLTESTPVAADTVAPALVVRSASVAQDSGASATVAVIPGAIDPATVAAAAIEAVSSEAAGVEPHADPLDPQPRTGEHELKTAAMTKVCDLRCQVVAFTENTIPGLGASQALYTILYPGKLGLTIPKSDGTTAVKITVMPTKIALGKGLVATGTF